MTDFILFSLNVTLANSLAEETPSRSYAFWTKPVVVNTVHTTSSNLRRCGGESWGALTLSPTVGRRPRPIGAAADWLLENSTLWRAIQPAVTATAAPGIIPSPPLTSTTYSHHPPSI